MKFSDISPRTYIYYVIIQGSPYIIRIPKVNDKIYSVYIEIKGYKKDNNIFDWRVGYSGWKTFSHLKFITEQEYYSGSWEHKKSRTYEIY